MTAKVISIPSSVRTLLSMTTPALLTSTFSSLCITFMAAAIRLIWYCEERSTQNMSSDLLPVFSLISARASRPLLASLHTIMTEAPLLARPSAICLPMPELAPVTRHCLALISSCIFIFLTLFYVDGSI